MKKDILLEIVLNPELMENPDLKEEKEEISIETETEEIDSITTEEIVDTLLQNPHLPKVILNLHHLVKVDPEVAAVRDLEVPENDYPYIYIEIDKNNNNRD